MAERKTEQRYHNGIPIDSEEEYMFLIWIEELIDNDYVEKIGRASTFILSEKLVNSYQEDKQLKTKIKSIEKKQVLLNDHVYTPEFLVIWNLSGRNLFLNSHTGIKFDKPIIAIDNGNYQTYIEIKSEYDYNNMTRLFVLNQKWMWQKYNIFVNLIHPSALFQATFTPQAYLTTKTGKQRVIHWKVRSLEEYVSSLNQK